MAARPEVSSILSFEEARAIVEQHAAQVRPRGRELLSLLDAAGRILAEAITSDRDLPPFRRATRDGYAVRSADLENVPAKLQVIGEVKAGGPQARGVSAGEAVSIMTGAAVPDGGDAVVMVEHTSLAANRLQVKQRVSAGDNVVPVGAEAKKG